MTTAGAVHALNAAEPARGRAPLPPACSSRSPAGDSDQSRQEIVMFKKLLAAAIISTAAIGTVAVPGVATAQVYVQPAPPPLRAEPAPGHRRGHVWSPGHWQWRGHRYVWIPGHYIAGRPGYAYSH